MIERMTAKKVHISEVMKGQWVKKEGMEPSFVVSEFGEKIARARILATVTNKFIAEDETFATLSLDDGTDTIRVKTFKTIKPIDTIQIGERVDAIGKIREYNEEIYMIPETISPITNPNMQTLRKLEILTKLKALKASGPEVPTENKKEELRKQILALLDENKEGMSFEEIIEKAEGNENEVELVISDILSEGICYEPTPGKIKKI